MASICLDIPLDEVSTRDLIDELEFRELNYTQKMDLLNIVKDDESNKLAYFLSVEKKYSILELEELFKEDNKTITVSEDQLNLF